MVGLADNKCIRTWSVDTQPLFDGHPTDAQNME